MLVSKSKGAPKVLAVVKKMIEERIDSDEMENRHREEGNNKMEGKVGEQTSYHM